jgi:hypothetical protein
MPIAAMTKAIDDAAHAAAIPNLAGSLEALNSPMLLS